LPRPHGGKLIDRVLEGPEKERAVEEARELAAIDVDTAVASDVENIAKGVFSPLEGFMGPEDLESVLENKRLPNDLPWTIPILLDASAETAERLSESDQVALRYRGKPLAILHLEQKYSFDRADVARRVFGTDNPTHPGVDRLLRAGQTLLAGDIDLLDPPEGPYDRYKLSPMETRILFKQKGWRTAVGFQTRNPPHLGHEYVQKTALTFVDGVFINPVIGKKKAGDFKDEVILEAYEALIKNFYPRDSAVMSILPFEMRYAGPREAVFHAIVRKNFGCTHFIVGRDHAGVGNYYRPYEAQEIFDDFPDLGIAPLFFKSFFHCNRCMSVTSEKACPHGENERIGFSGTRIRELFSNGQMPPKEVMRPEVAEMIAKHPQPFVEEN